MRRGEFDLRDGQLSERGGCRWMAAKGEAMLSPLAFPRGMRHDQRLVRSCRDQNSLPGLLQDKQADRFNYEPKSSSAQAAGSSCDRGGRVCGRRDTAFKELGSYCSQ